MDGDRTSDLENGRCQTPVKEADIIAPAIEDSSTSEKHDEKTGPAIDTAAKKKNREFEEVPVEVAPPPPYSAPPAAIEDRKTWKGRRILLLAIALLILLILLLATLLGVLLTRHHSNAAISSTSPSTSLTPSSPVPSSPVPSSSADSGDASAPLLNTAIDMVSVLNTATTADVQADAVLTKIFFQDDENYLCEKSSTSGFNSWALGDSGNRIMPVMNGTPIAAVVYSHQSLPIRVFFVNTDGFLADIIQEQYGATWANGSLSQQQFTPYLTWGVDGSGTRTKSIAAAWCDGYMPIVYVQGKDLELVAFQLSDLKNSSTWSAVPGNHGGNPGISSSTNFASTCMFDGYGNAPVFVNQYNGIEETGNLSVLFGDNVTQQVTLPPSSASLYRPNTPLSVVFGNFAPTVPTPSGDNMSIFLIYPLPQSLTCISPNPSLHILYASPYGESDPKANWSLTYDTDTGIVPYALGAQALFDPEDIDEESWSVDGGIDGAMPRSWAGLTVGEDDATVVLVWLTEDGRGMKGADVLGGAGRSWDVIVPPS